MTSASVSGVEKMVQAICNAARHLRVAFGNTWTGYGDSWLKTILRDCCS
jgi:hypothetical protein